MDRRKFVATLAGAAASSALCKSGVPSGETRSAQPKPQTSPSLKQLGAPCGLRVGCATSKVRLQNVPGLSSFFTFNFNLLTPVNEMKWSPIHPEPDRYDFKEADFLVDFAQTNGIAVHGHNLCWNAGNPGWFKSALSKDNARNTLESHIRTVMNRYKGKMDSWDVVNEPIALWFNRPDGLYGGPWIDALGPEYIDIAFHTAAETDPEPLRIINIHNVEHGDSYSGKARQAAIDLMTRLVKNKVPVQAVGLESHLDAWRPIDKAALANFVQSFRDLGLQVLITEFDVNDAKISGDIATRDQAVAAHYREYIADFYATAGTPNRLILWSDSDRGNWMDYVGNSPRWKREDGTNTHRPGILDDKMMPKPSYAALVSAIQTICAG